MHFDILGEIRTLKEDTLRVRRTLHRFPELGWQETATTDFLAEELRACGIPFERPLTTGLIAVIEGGCPGRTIGLRADIDALPITEQTGLSFASENEGVMHACGHDLHAAGLLQTAKLLMKHRELLKGTVKCIFQPCEEFLPSGAEAMIATGLLNDCEIIYGLHVEPDMAVGTVNIAAGPRMAASAQVNIKIHGKGGHGGDPASAVDAIPAAAAVIMNLQTFVSRELSLSNASVLSIGTLHAGDGRCIIAENAVMEGTFRYYSEEALRQATEAVTRIAQNTAAAFRAEAEVEVRPTGSSPVVNPEALAAFARSSASELFGADALVPYPQKGFNEDFGAYSKICPSLFMFVGTANDAQFTSYPAHNAKFIVDENALDYSMGLFIKLVLDTLS